MRLYLAVLFLALAAPEEASAQTSALRGRMAGLVVERFYDEDSRFLVLGYRWTDLRASGPGFDGVVGVIPRSLVGGSLQVQADAGLVQAVRTGPVTLLLGGGVSNFVALEQSFEFYPGLQAGLALLVPLEARLVGRVDLARHVYLAGSETYSFWSIGLSLPVLSVR